MIILENIKVTHDNLPSVMKDESILYSRQKWDDLWSLFSSSRLGNTKQTQLPRHLDQLHGVLAEQEEDGAKFKDIW